MDRFDRGTRMRQSEGSESTNELAWNSAAEASVAPWMPPGYASGANAGRTAKAP